MSLGFSDCYEKSRGFGELGFGDVQFRGPGPQGESDLCCWAWALGLSVKGSRCGGLPSRYSYIILVYGLYAGTALLKVL